MGWFDNEEGGNTGNGSAEGAPPRQTMKAAAPSPSGSESGSTLGRQLRVDGTIVCGEDLAILGKVEGTIRAKGTLVIAEKADVRATIDGQRVLVYGKVEGDVHGEEKVVLGPTAHLTGNIDVSSLEILEGAYFKGNVEMKPGKKVVDERPASKSAKPAGPGGANAPQVGKGKSAPDDMRPISGAGAQESGAKQDSKKEGAKPSAGPGSS